jgi:hypothetical protein
VRHPNRNIWNNPRAGKEFGTLEKTLRGLKSDHKSTAGFVRPIFIGDMQQRPEVTLAAAGLRLAGANSLGQFLVPHFDIACYAIGSSFE